MWQPRKKFTGWGELCVACGALTDWVCPECLKPLCEFCDEHDCRLEKQTDASFDRL